jgi:hypothetical protein
VLPATLAGEPVSEPPTLGRGPGFLERLAKFFTSLAGVITAAVLLGGAIAGAAAFVKGQENGEPETSEKVEAQLTVLSFDPNVDYRDYRSRPGRGIVVAAKPGTPGNVFYLKARIEGFRREALQLRWFTYDPNGERRPDSRGEATAQMLFEPEAPLNTQVAQVWVKEPGSWVDGFWESDSGRGFFVRFELYSGDVLLASTDSPRFSVF